MSGNPTFFDIVYAVVGLKAAGKGEFGAYLAAKHDFTIYTMSTPMRAVAEKEVDAMVRAGERPAGSKYTVPDLVRIGDRERGIHGAGYWAKELIRLANERQVQKLIVDGVRNLGEIVTLRESMPEGVPFKLVGIVADFDIRFARAQKRQQSGDPITLEGFQQMDIIDRGGPSLPEHGQQVDLCLSMVPPGYLYDNSGSLEDYHDWINACLSGRLPQGGATYDSTMYRG